MPVLSKLSICQFRNLRSAILQPGAQLNLIHGENGSGKTSLLEAISVLAHGRSFRTHKFRRLINHDEKEFTLFGQVEEQSLSHKLGITRRSNGEMQIRINARPAYTAAELAECLPLLVMNANSFQLLEGSARVRRQFFDWLVFHVKHDFKEAWKMYSKCVKHRNSLLRRDKISPQDLLPWDKELDRLGVLLETNRKQVFETFLPAFTRTLNKFSFVEDLDTGDLTIAYHSGWKEEGTYLEQLKANFERDKSLGYTAIGSHKSDLKIALGKVPAVEELSRGQQKSLIVSLFLAEAEVFHKLTGRVPVFLLDDLPAELDKHNMAVVGESLQNMGSQVFITAIEPNQVLDSWKLREESLPAMFHVKHGELTTNSRE